MMKKKIFLIFALCIICTLAALSVSAGGLKIEVTSEDELVDALSKTEVVDEINIVDSFTITKDCAIKYDGNKINYYSDTVLTISDGVTLTLIDGGTLGSVWATFEGNWDDPLLPNAKCINNGNIILEKGGFLDLDFDTNNGNILVKDKGLFGACVTNNGEITVERGGIFASGQGGEIRNNGIITVSDGAIIASRFGSTLNNTSSGKLILDGEFNCGCVGDEFWFKNDGDVQGRGSLTVYEAAHDVMPSDLDEMIEKAMSELGQTARFENWDDISIYKEVEAASFDELVLLLTADRTVAGEHVDGNMDIIARITDDVTVTGELDCMSKIVVGEPYRLTIADGGALTASVDNDGVVWVENGGLLATTMGGDIKNKGSIIVDDGGELRSQMGGRIINEIGIIELEGTYTEAFRTVVIGSALGSEIAYITANVPDNAALVAARYDEGVLTDVKITANPLMKGNIEMDGTGEQFKLFLLDLAECKPFCENWKNQ